MSDLMTDNAANWQFGEEEEEDFPNINHEGCATGVEVRS